MYLHEFTILRVSRRRPWNNNRSLLNLVELDRYHYEASNHDTIPVSIERDVIAGWEENRGSVMRKIVSLRYLRGLWR